ncbi:MAG: DUF6478 family protein [Rhodobacteraceae bacterium]|nr:DUF6478 family protein [Paracoccaceae bacterium]
MTRGLSTGIIGKYRMRRDLRRWEKLADIARTVPVEGARDLRIAARALAQRANTVSHIADERLTRPYIGSNAMKLPPSTDWSHRPELWKGPISPPGHAPARNSTAFGADVKLYHDSKTPALALRQVRNSRPEDLSPFGLSIDVFDFDGSFLSLVIEAPDGIVAGLESRHILRLSMRASAEHDVGVSVRLNLKHGPNTEQVSRRATFAPDGAETEFDMAYVPFREGRAEHVWFDIFLEETAMNQVSIHDLTLSRHVRASA